MIKTWKLAVASAFAGLALTAGALAADGAGQPHASALSAGKAVVVAEAATPAPGAVAKPGEAGHAAAPDAAHGGEAGEHGGGFPPFDGRTFGSQLLWLVVSFGLLYLLMSRVTLPRIGRILEERHDRIADDLEEAAKHRAESEAAQAAYEKALGEARAKANTIAGETRARLTAESDANRKSLEASLATKLSDAEARIAATKTEALTHVRSIAVDAAHSIVFTLAGAPPAPSDVEGAVDSALAGKPAA